MSKLPVFGLDCGAKGAVLSPCRTYRYVLSRGWMDQPRRAVFIGLNPSTADETKDDATIRRCIGFARSWGFGELIMLNLFAFRATKPEVMLAAPDPIGPDNDRTLIEQTNGAGIVVAAWGCHGDNGRGYAVRKMLQGAGVELNCLRLTKHGSPQHPLYLPANAEPARWTQGL